MTSNSSDATRIRRVGELTVREISDTQAEFTRMFNVPRRLVFEAMLASGMEQGAAETYNRLEEYARSSRKKTG